MNDVSAYNENELLLRTADGDPLAFRMIYDRYRNRIYGYAFQLTGSEDKANEVVQEVFLKLWLYRNKLSQVHNFNAWLHTVARNGFFNALKKTATEALVAKELLATAEEGVNTTEHFVLDRENQQLLQRLVNKLPPQQKQVFELRLQGLRQEEIARQLHISKNTVKVHLNRALKTVRDGLNNHTDTALSIAFILWARNF